MRLGGLWCLFLTLCSVSAAPAAKPLDPACAKADPSGSLLWYDIRALGIEGQGWTDIKAPYDRLPAKAEGKVPPAVWNLSRQSAGLCVRFDTDATALSARWSLTSPRLAMEHMPATGVSGLDLYVRTDDGRWRWLAIGIPSKQTTTAALFKDLPGVRRHYLLYLPLYNGVSSVELGVPKESKIYHADPRVPEKSKPIIFYGTSITQGGCASRPGMVHTAILGRWLDRPVINLGFSGNGRMEPALGELLAELDPAVYVLDCLPNLRAKEVSERVDPTVRTLRQAHPSTPILLVEDRSYTNSFLIRSTKERNETSRAALRTVYKRLQTDKVPGVSYLPGANLLGADGEDTVDSSHPTDLGFVRQAEAFKAALAPLLAVK
jgi:hypothetical protein